MNRTRLASLTALVAALTASAPAFAAAVKVKFECSQTLADGSTAALSTAGTSRISGKSIYCSVSSDDARIGANGVVVKTVWHKLENGALRAMAGKEIHPEPFGEGDGPGFQFSLERGRDWDECAADLSVPVKVKDAKGKVLFDQTLVFKQDCAPAPAATPAKSGGAKDPNSEVVFAAGELEKIEEPAQVAAQQWAQALLDEDAAFFVQGFPKAGVRIGKTTVKPATVQAAMDKAGGMRKLTGMLPQFGCPDPKVDANCKWDKWHVEVKSKSEFWVYNTDDSFYGPYRSLVFKKAGGKWAWSAMADLDKGEP